MKIDNSFTIKQRQGTGRMLMTPTNAMNRSVILGGKKVRRDSTAINGHGGKASLIEHLTEQKEALKKQRDETIAQTLEKGGTKQDIKDMLKVYEAQLQALDEEIESLQADMLKRQVEQITAKKKAAIGNEEKTDLERLNSKMARIDGYNRELDRTKVVDKVRTKAEGDAAVLKTQAELDRSLVNNMVERNGNIDPGDIDTTPAEKKEAEADALAEMADHLMSEVAGRAKAIADKVISEGSTGGTVQTGAVETEEDELVEVPEDAMEAGTVTKEASAEGGSVDIPTPEGSALPEEQVAPEQV